MKRKVQFENRFYKIKIGNYRGKIKEVKNNKLKEEYGIALEQSDLTKDKVFIEFDKEDNHNTFSFLSNIDDYQFIYRVIEFVNKYKDVYDLFYEIKYNNLYNKFINNLERKEKIKKLECQNKE